ncbi:hypothetical protein T310_0516, partial [Rasamsonia emersonii CBS 393.64]
LLRLLPRSRRLRRNQCVGIPDGLHSSPFQPAPAQKSRSCRPYTMLFLCRISSSGVSPCSFCRQYNQVKYHWDRGSISQHQGGNIGSHGAMVVDHFDS